MITIAIDTSHFVCVGSAREGVPGPSFVVEDRRAHAEQAMVGVQHVVDELGVTLADVDAFVVGMGPGPFTGLRVGIVTAQMLAAVDEKPLHRVCSLDAIAGQVADEGREGAFVVASDARRKELYWATYSAAGVRTGEPRVSPPQELPPLPVYGAVPEQYREMLAEVHERKLDPSWLAAHPERLAKAPSEPYYLREADAQVPGAPKSALPRLRVRR